MFTGIGLGLVSALLFMGMQNANEINEQIYLRGGVLLDIFSNSPHYKNDLESGGLEYNLGGSGEAVNSSAYEVNPKRRDPLGEGGNNTLLDQPGIVNQPLDFIISQNSPNPFNPTTKINYGIPESADVIINVYTLTGKKVDSLVNNQMDAGYHEVTFDGSSLGSGVYIYRLQAGDYEQARKMTLLK